MIDLDDFKIYNDTQGHDTGDAVLKAVVGAIKDCIRGTDTLIRYGGDEFLLIMPGVENEDNFNRKLKEIKRNQKKSPQNRCVGIFRYTFISQHRRYNCR